MEVLFRWPEPGPSRPDGLGQDPGHQPCCFSDGVPFKNRKNSCSLTVVLHSFYRLCAYTMDLGFCGLNVDAYSWQGCSGGLSCLGLRSRAHWDLPPFSRNGTVSFREIRIQESSLV